MVIISLIVFVLSGACTYVGIYYFRQFSLKRQWLDIPNERSSHKKPTPRGAGLIVFLVVTIGYMASIFSPNSHFFYGYFLGAFVVAAVSWLDDLYSLSIGWRLLAHLTAAVLFVSIDGYWTVVGIANEYSIFLPSVIGPLITVIWIVWLINAYNFMDGIDGIAGAQGAVAAGTWAIIAYGISPSIYFFCLVITGSVVAFLVQNWDPARVFMGDVGSAFIGFTFATLPLTFAREAETGIELLPVVGVLILWPFIFDSVLTLFRRLSSGERVWQAHKDHLYQRLVTAGYSHSTVSAIYGLFALVGAAAAILFMENRNWVKAVVACGMVLLSILFVVIISRVYRISVRETRSNDVTA